jgi:pimeloyl-ACP methyl ester carboxylesterase
MSTWILLRGLTREARHWGAFAQAFAASLGRGEEIVLIDLPGNGAERTQAAPLDVPAMTRFVRARAASLGMRAPYAVLAMSLGGMVATDWAQRHPDEIERLVLINTSMRPFCAMHERLRPSAWPGLVRIALAWNDAGVAERGVLKLTCNRNDRAALDIAAWTQIRRNAPVSAANALRQLWAAARFRAHAEAPRCPVLLLSSQQDHLVDPACSRHIAAHWRTAHAVHPDAGHDLPHDDAPWTATTVAEWLRTLA